MAAFCARHGYSGRTRPEVLVERLRTHLLSASAGTTAGKAFTAGLFVDQLELLNTQRRGVFTSVTELEQAIALWATHWNDDPKPFIWKISTAEIIEKVQRGRAALAHQIDSTTDH